MNIFKAVSAFIGRTPTSTIEPSEDFIKALPAPDAQVATPLAMQISPTDIANAYLLNDHDKKQPEGQRGLDYEQLRVMTRVPIIASIIQTRINQIAEFAKPSYDGRGIGFTIRLKDRRGIPSEADLETIQDIYKFMLSCGDNRIDFESNFEAFLRILVRDSLSFDQACFEVVRSRSGRVAGFMNVDSSTIRRTRMTADEKELGRRDPEGIHFCQIIDNRVKAEFGVKDLCFGIRRPRSEVKYKGYGYPELEECMSIITNLINAEVFNAANFTNGISVSGIVAVKTKMNPQLFRAFRREFYSMLSGSQNAKKTPLIQLDPDGNEDLKALNLSQSNKEMEFENWINYQIRQLCGLWQIDPMEIGFNFGEVGVRSSLNQQDPSSKVLMSKEKGLRPLLRAVEAWINKYIINELDDNFELVFSGMDIIPSNIQLDMDIKKVTSYLTVNELRASKDLPPLEGGDIILHNQADNINKGELNVDQST